VIPRDVRKAVGLEPGPVDIVAVGAKVQIEVPTAGLADEDGFVVLRRGLGWSDERLREFRLADQE